ncbi:hypothetical protein MAR_010148, partial [Mya arenaria]
MAWRTKTLLLVCFLLTVSFLIVQDNISLVVDTKNRGPNAPAAASTYFTLSKHVPEPPDVIQNESKAAVSRFVQLPPDTHRNNLTTVVGNTANDGGNVEGGAFVSQAIPVPTVVLSPADQETEHGLRISHLKTACAASEEERLVETKKANLTEFFYSQSHDFAYCKVPKSGSTFWMKVFMMLTKGNDVYESLQNMSRGDIHAKTRPLRVNPARLLRKKVPTVVVSRNPFTRLFSAFVDKSAKFKFSKEVVTIEVLSAIKKKPLSNVLSKQQRRKHLKEAYRGYVIFCASALFTLDGGKRM